MLRKEQLAVLGFLALAAAVGAAPPRWRWTPGQVLTYRAEQATQAIDQLGDNRLETSSRLELTKQWTVTAVDSQGIATLQLKLLALKLQTVTPGGEVLRFDSTDLERSTPQLREQMAMFVGVPLAVLRLDQRGQLVEVIRSDFGPVSRYESELPFVGVLPEGNPHPDHAWERSYDITLAPPQGAGEKYPAVQKYRLRNAEGSNLVISLATEVKDQPAALADRVPLLQVQPEGEFVFDVRAGRMVSAILKIDKTLQGHRGPNSSHRFLSNYKEELLER